MLNRISHPNSLESWSKGRIDTECLPAYRDYERELKQHYTHYFQRHPELRCPNQPYSARTIGATLPRGSQHLSWLIPRSSLHPFARSGRSSQMLALALLGSACAREPSLKWFWNILDLDLLVKDAGGTWYAFEQELPPSALGEKPRATKIDFVAGNSALTVCLEAKWSEAGIGICSCSVDGDGSPLAGNPCAERVASRSAYWAVASQLFGFPSQRLPLFPCPVSLAYQAIRTAAAARFLSRQKQASAFVLLYDENNPFFRRTGSWPGWPAMLGQCLKKHEADGFYFRALSWEAILHRLPLTSAVRRWAAEKHRLGG